MDYEIDTITTPPGNVNSSSRMMMTYGRALELSIDDLINKIKNLASLILNIECCDIYVDGTTVYNKYNINENISFAEILNSSAREIEKIQI